MKKFRAPYNRAIGYYKDLDHYIDAVWKKNKDYIERTFRDQMTSKKMFREILKESLVESKLKATKTNIDKTLNKMTYSPTFSKVVDYKNYRAYNFSSVVKKHNIRFRDEKGRFTKYNPDNLKFKGYTTIGSTDCAVYQYQDQVIIQEQYSKKNGASNNVEVMSLMEFQNLGFNI